MTTQKTNPTSFPRRIAEGEPPLTYPEEGTASLTDTSIDPKHGSEWVQGPSLSDEDLAGTLGLPPEGDDFRGTIRDVREVLKADGKMVAIVAIMTDDGIEVDDVLLVKAPRLSPMLRDSLRRARLYVDLSGKRINLTNWAEAKGAMVGTSIIFDVRHEHGHDGVPRHKVFNVRGATGA